MMSKLFEDYDDYDFKNKTIKVRKCQTCGRLCETTSSFLSKCISCDIQDKLRKWRENKMVKAKNTGTVS